MMLIYRSLFTLMICMLPLYLFGQLRVGPLAGVSLNRWSFADKDEKDIYESKSTMGYHGGVSLNYKVNDRYSLQTEWLYLYRLKNLTYSRNQLVVRDQASLHYVAIPLLYRVSFHTEIKKSHQEWYLNAGPALHYWLGGKGSLSTNEQSPYTHEGRLDYTIRFGAPGEYGATEYIEPANRWQMALYAGGGVVFDLGFGRHVSFDLRTSLGQAKSFFSSSAKGDFGLHLYQDNLQSSIVSWSMSVAYVKDIDMFAVLKKGKTVSTSTKSSRPVTTNKSGRGKRKYSRAKTSG